MAPGNRILAISPHPDDCETGCGGLLAEGGEWRGALYLCERRYRKEIQQVAKILGLDWARSYEFAADHLPSLSMPVLAGVIEAAVAEHKPDLLLLPEWTDCHQDHRVTYEAGMIAARPFSSTVRTVLTYEVPGPTDWGLDGHFQPNLYVRLQSASINKKIEAFERYSAEVRTSPHPRSSAGIEVRARFRGMQCGAPYAEAFRVVRQIF